VERAKYECDLVFSDDADKMDAIEEILDFMVSHKRSVPAVVGTARENIIKRRSGNLDPYIELKVKSNEVARKLLPLARSFYDQSDDKLEALVRIASAANSMEFGVKGHNFDITNFEEIFEDTLREELDGDLNDAKRYLDRFDKILYITDNAGEIIFDLFVIERLEELGKRVVVAPKSAPVLNDITEDELREMTDRQIEPTGPVVGISLDNIRPEVREILFDAEWLVLAKGMGNYETMTEFDDLLKKRLIYIFRAKCETVARFLGVKKGSLVVRAV
jgi:hypothetical protein